MDSWRAAKLGAQPYSLPRKILQLQSSSSVLIGNWDLVAFGKLNVADSQNTCQNNAKSRKFSCREPPDVISESYDCMNPLQE